MIENWKNYLKFEKEKYNKIGYVKCPAFDNEKVYFNHYGIDHLIYKNGVPRSQNTVEGRFHLLKFVPKIIEGVKSIDKEEKRIRNKSYAYFWTIKQKIYGENIRIILRRLGNEGKLHFFSVMKE